MTDRIKTVSTSKRTAAAEPIVLRIGPGARLVFHPTLVENQNDPDASVRGTFTYQRKGRNDAWEDVHDLDLSQLRKGEAVQLELRSSEVLVLFQGLASLYEIYGEHGVPFGEQYFVAVARRYWEALVEDPGLRNEAFTDKELGAVHAFARWVAEQPAAAWNALQALQGDDLANLDAAAGVARLRKFLATWESNRSRADEDYWQTLITEESWVLGQLLGAPFVIIRGKAYVGGKSFEDHEGRIADFLYKNRLTGNVLLVEIKTPVTALLGSRYRQTVYSPSADVTGAVTQILDQRQVLVANYQALSLGPDTVPFHPRAIVIAGDIESQLDDKLKLRSFELFRNELRGVDVVTFDELAAKAEALLGLFESAT